MNSRLLDYETILSNSEIEGDSLIKLMLELNDMSDNMVSLAAQMCGKYECKVFSIQ